MQRTDFSIAPKWICTQSRINNNTRDECAVACCTLQFYGDSVQERCCRCSGGIRQNDNSKMPQFDTYDLRQVYTKRALAFFFCHRAWAIIPHVSQLSVNKVDSTVLMYQRPWRNMYCTYIMRKGAEWLNMLLLNFNSKPHVASLTKPSHGVGGVLNGIEMSKSRCHLCVSNMSAI